MEWRFMDLKFGRQAHDEYGFTISRRDADQSGTSSQAFPARGRRGSFGEIRGRDLRGRKPAPRFGLGLRHLRTQAVSACRHPQFHGSTLSGVCESAWVFLDSFEPRSLEASKPFISIKSVCHVHVPCLSVLSTCPCLLDPAEEIQETETRV